MRFRLAFPLLPALAFAGEADSLSVFSSSAGAVSDSLGGKLSEIAQSAFVSGLELSMICGVAICCVAVAVSLIRRGAGY